MIARAVEGETLVMGAAIGLQAEQVETFLDSLEKRGYRGSVVLFADRALARVLSSRRGTLELTVVEAAQWIPFRFGLLKRKWIMRRLWRPAQELLWRSSRLPIAEPARSKLLRMLAQILFPPMDTRFLRYQRYLELRPYRRVLLTDVRDVVFQEDPFTSLPIAGLGVSIETSAYDVASQSHNALWVKRVYGEEMLERIGTNRVSCVGVTYGDREAITQYLHCFNRELLALDPAAISIGGADTAIHNKLLWTKELRDVHLFEPLEGPVATLNEIPFSELEISPKGVLLNRDGSPAAVLHQYDRIPPLRDAVLAALRS